MSAQQERVSFPMRVLFTLFALDVCTVTLFIRFRTQPAVPSAASHYFELGLAAAAAVILAVLVWMWWRPIRRLGRVSTKAGGIAMLLGLASGATPAEANAAPAETPSLEIKFEGAKAIHHLHTVTLATSPGDRDVPAAVRMECWK